MSISRTPTPNKAREIAELRRSNAAGPHRRPYNRAAETRRALAEQDTPLGSVTALRFTSWNVA